MKIVKYNKIYWFYRFVWNFIDSIVFEPSGHDWLETIPRSRNWDGSNGSRLGLWPCPRRRSRQIPSATAPDAKHGKSSGLHGCLPLQEVDGETSAPLGVALMIPLNHAGDGRAAAAKGCPCHKVAPLIHFLPKIVILWIYMYICICKRICNICIFLVYTYSYLYIYICSHTCI